MSESQRKFAGLLGQLFNFVYASGFELTLGDAWAKDGHVQNSLHYQRLAIDVNLFIDGVWITEDHPTWQLLGKYWKSLHPLCRWGGDIVGKVDLNHFSFAPNEGDPRI